MNAPIQMKLSDLSAFVCVEFTDDPITLATEALRELQVEIRAVLLAIHGGEFDSEDANHVLSLLDAWAGALADVLTGIQRQERETAAGQ